jgi:hypothetical protein
MLSDAGAHAGSPKRPPAEFPPCAALPEAPAGWLAVSCDDGRPPYVERQGQARLPRQGAQPFAIFANEAPEAPHRQFQRDEGEGSICRTHQPQSPARQHFRELSKRPAAKMGAPRSLSRVYAGGGGSFWNSNAPLRTCAADHPLPKSRTNTATDLCRARHESPFFQPAKALRTSGGINRRSCSHDWDSGEARRVDPAFSS